MIYITFISKKLLLILSITFEYIINPLLVFLYMCQNTQVIKKFPTYKKTLIQKIKN